jgi:formate hydrogenlyase transcriptional activator
MKQSDNSFHVMIDAIPTMAWCSLPDGSVEFLNQRWHDYTGLSREQAAGWGWKVTIHPDDIEKLTHTWLSILASGEPGEVEARLRRFDGEHRWFLIRAVPVEDGQGNVVRWYGTNADIEDLKRAEEKLRQAGDLRTVIDTIPTMAWSALPDGSVDFLNRRWLDYAGLSAKEAMHWGWKVAIHPDDLPGMMEVFERAVKSGEPFDLDGRFRRFDGEFRWFLFRGSPLRDESGNVVKWYGTNTDLEDRKRAELELQKAFAEIKILKDRLFKENLVLREQIDQAFMFEEIVGSSPVLKTVLSTVVRVAPTDSTVLITGETGTGKELIARAIHKRSKRASRAFIRVNCAAIPPSLIASELFGHEKGAFTGALQRRAGRFEAADGGTIFLDEIGELSSETQTALLRVLQEREFERVGSSQPISVDVRVLAATNQDLEAAVSAGRFRQDLYYRFNVFPIRVPSLRERKDDIPLLVEYLVQRYAKRTGKRINDIEKKTLDVFQGYEWPGNIRELQNVVERAVILCDGETFSVEEAWLQRKSNQQAGQHAPRSGVLAEGKKDLADREREAIEAALEECKGRVSGPRGAAVKLGIPHQTLESKIASLGIDKRRFELRSLGSKAV